MALKGNKTKKTARRNDGVKAEIRKAAREGARNTKIMAHNGFIALVFGAAMAMTCVIATEIAFMATGFVVGNSMVASGDTYSEFIVTFASLAMTCGFTLFFAFKIENALAAAMRKRFWHKDPETGEIIKNNHSRGEAGSGADEK